MTSDCTRFGILHARDGLASLLCTEVGLHLGWQVALVEPPDFSYGLVIQGGDITFLPGLESWLNSFIKTAVLQPYILPDGVLVPLAPGCGREVRV